MCYVSISHNTLALLDIQLFLFVIPMFLSCPVSFDLIDAEWYQDVDVAKEDALDWSVELGGENVLVYQAIEDEDGVCKFKKLYSVCA